MNETASHNAGSQKLLISAAYYLAFITLGLTVGAIGPVLPTLASHTGAALSAISAIFITNSLGYMVGTWVGGRAYDRFPGHRLLAAALVVASVMLFFVPILSLLWLLALVIAVLGFFQGSMDVGANTLIVWLHGAKVRPFMNGLHFAFGFGALVAPIVVAQVSALTGNIHWVYWLFALVQIPIALWIWRLPSPAAPSKTAFASQTKVQPSLLLLALLMVFFFLYVGVETGYGNWIFTYATTLKMADAARAAYLTSTFWGAFTLFRLVGIWISTRVSPATILWVDFAGSAAGLGLVLAAPGSQTALWAGTIILGASIASIFPTMLTLAEQRLHLTGAIMSWCFIGSGAGQMLLPWVIGQIFVPLGPTSMMVFIMVDLVINGLVLGLVLGRSKQVTEA